jgi:uncharacterized protein
MVVNERDEFVTQRDFPKMATVWVEELDGGIELASERMDEPLFVPLENANTDVPRNVKVWASTVLGQAVSPEADDWLTQCLGPSLRLVYMPDSTERTCSPTHAKNGEIVSFADGYPFLLTNEASLADLNRRIGDNAIKLRGNTAALPMSRFRANIVIKGADAWAEDDWKELQIGEHVFRNVKPCARCQVTTTDQATGEVIGPEPLATLGAFRNSTDGVLFGVNLTCVDQTGLIRVGDTVKVLY